jgi:ribonuclease-3
MDLLLLQQTIDYYFTDQRLLQLSLIHKSYLGEKKRKIDLEENNERLEFLGDAVLELVVTEFLYQSFKDSEGYLTTLRSALVNYRIMGQIGYDLGLDNYILISTSERQELGKPRITIVADCLEAVLGAIYLDGGYEPAKKFVSRFILSRLDQVIKNREYRDPKTELQEFVQKCLKTTPQYRLLSSEGKDHNRMFVSGAYVAGNLVGTGRGSNKQESESEAAREALLSIRKNNRLKVKFVDVDKQST